ncbi:formate dehydrogenase subunit alpha [Candidatus Methanocrinis natronophilus]|uniref:Formate dehydrogenase subunit alpha n=1 Tax=Candidatus Methanocrinis natronophilus TaxID=3033396 RepID=A0ABT5X5J3_9EURY|nr:formate dehydrogenase subunit alpha [Candidatus Methanocrinis natronophilus]MDF0589959.1 formate dehydrogenase subunit alpha [Candidatus Methanocrinis natronophilus]
MTKVLVPTICPYCGAGCGFFVAVERERAVGIEQMPYHPVGEGALCSKGNASLEILHHQERLTSPLKRKDDGWAKISWDEAVGLVARGIGEAMRDYGPEKIALLASSKCTNEENYLIQKLARLLGTPHIDNCARLCHAPSVVGLNRTLGAAGMTNPIPDIANSRCIFIIGSNLAENHPVVSRWIHRAKDAGAVVIVADPRATPTSWMADIFLQLSPGTDVALLKGIAHQIVKEGLIDRGYIAERTRGFEEFEGSVGEFTPEMAAEITGVPAEDIIRAARAYASSPASMILYSMGITQHTTGTDNVQAVSNLALITGHIGRAGTGVMPLRGQNNVQGACDMGALVEFYPGYRRADDPGTIDLFSTAWEAPALPTGPGLTATEMIGAAASGDIRAMYIVGEDPANSDPSSLSVKRALEGLDFLVVQDIFMTATALVADVVLPAAAWAEKEGSFTNTERRVQWSSKAVEPPGSALPDLEIICLVARSLGLDFDYPDAASVLAEINRTVPQYAGITRERLGKEGGLVWPCPSCDHPGTPILHSSGFRLADGRGSIVPVHYRPAAEGESLEYPFLLTTGRIALHHNAGSMTRRSPSLIGRAPDLFVEINPADAEKLGIDDGDLVAVSTERGETEAAARLTEGIKRGVVFMPFHFPGTNILTTEAADPEARIPEFKVSACRIARRD